MRRKKSPSGDSELGQSGKFWSIQERGLFKCQYCIYLICDYSPSFFLPIDPQTDVLRPTSVQLNKKEHVGIYLTGIILSLIVLLPVITSWTLIFLYSPQNPFVWATVSNHTVAIKVPILNYPLNIEIVGEFKYHSKYFKYVSVKSDWWDPKWY